METRTYKVYKFKELTKAQQDKVIEKLWDLNVRYDWWEDTYEDALNIGLKITGFDLDRSSYCQGQCKGSALTTASLIVNNHGEHCETYKTAGLFLKQYAEITKNVLADEYGDLSREIQTELGSLTDEFLESILEDYRIILQKEYEYLTSEVAILETIEANDYDFTEDGKID